MEASDVIGRLSGIATGERGAAGNTHLTPYLMVVSLFAFVYLYMPNTRVRLGPALVGAVFGGVLWAAVGAIFTRIVVYSAKTAAVYASLPARSGSSCATDVAANASAAVIPQSELATVSVRRTPPNNVGHAAATEPALPKPSRALVMVR